MRVCPLLMKTTKELSAKIFVEQNVKDYNYTSSMYVSYGCMIVNNKLQVVVLASLAPLRPLNALYEPLQTCHGDDDSVSSGRWVGAQHLPLTQKHSSVALPSAR